MPHARLLVFLALGVLLTGCQSASTAAPAVAPSEAQVQRVLVARSTAALQGVDRRVAGLPLTAWWYQLQSVRPGPGPSAVTVRALLRYRFATDPVRLPAASAERELVVVPDPTAPVGASVRSERPVGAWLPWDVGRGRWSASTGGAVLDLRSSPGNGDAAAVLAATARADRAVTAVLGPSWSRAPLVVAVDGAAAVAHLTGRTEPDAVGLVAVSTTDRVYLDVRAWLALPAAGRQVVLTHEVTHLATGSASTDLPLWLEEGFADFVGMDGSGLSLRNVAAGVLDPIRRGAAPPATLPTDADFGAGTTDAPGAYAGAWLACRLIASDVGTRGLVAVYRAATSGPGTSAQKVDTALRAVTGVGTAAWTQRWRASLRMDVRAGGPGPEVLL